MLRFNKTLICLVLTLLTMSLVHAQKKEKKGLKGLLGTNVETSHDRFENTTTYRMTGNKVKIKGAVGSGIAKGVLGLLRKDATFSIVTTRLQLENHIKDGTSHLAVIVKVSLEDNGVFRVMPGESLVLLADGERIGLSTDGAFNTDDFVIDGNSKTHARYPITKEQIEQVINAETVDFRIMQQGFEHGQAEARDKEGTTFEGVFSSKNTKAWSDFYNQYIISQPEKS